MSHIRRSLEHAQHSGSQHQLMAHHSMHGQSRVPALRSQGSMGGMSLGGSGMGMDAGHMSAGMAGGMAGGIAGGMGDRGGGAMGRGGGGGGGGGGGASNDAILAAVNGMWQDMQAMRMQVDSIRRDVNQMRGDVLRLSGQLTELGTYVRTEVALQSVENRFEPRSGQGPPTTLASGPSLSSMPATGMAGPSMGAITAPAGPGGVHSGGPAGAMNGMGDRPGTSGMAVGAGGVGAHGGSMWPPVVSPMGPSGPMAGQAAVGMGGPMASMATGGMAPGPGASGPMAAALNGSAGGMAMTMPPLGADPSGMGPGSGMGGPMGVGGSSLRPRTSDGLGPSISQRGSVVHTSRSAATSVLSVRDLRDPSNRGSREDVLRTVYDAVDPLGRGKVAFADLCEYVDNTARSSSALPSKIGGTADDWTHVQRIQCCVFLTKSAGGLAEAFRPFGFDEHSAITWEDFAKFSHRVYEGIGPSRAGSRMSSPVKRSRPASVHQNMRDRDRDGSPHDGSPGRRRGRGGDDDGDDDRASRRSRSKRRTSDDDRKPRRRAKSRGALRHEEDSDGSVESPGYKPVSRRSPSRGTRTTRAKTAGRRGRLRKNTRRARRRGGYATESNMTDGGGGGDAGTGYYSTGGGRRGRGGDSDSDDEPPPSIGRRRGTKKRRGKKSKSSVKKPPKDLPNGWQAAWDAQYNRFYYYNKSGVVTWDRPAE